MKAVVEMPLGTRYKYEINSDGSALTLNRSLAIPVPWNYGYIPETLCEDGDPIDVFIATKEPIPPLTQVELDVIGILICDDNGEEDNKLLAYIKDDVMSKESIKKDLFLYEVRRYLYNYKSGFRVKREMGKREAKKEIKKAQSSFKKRSKLI